MRIDPICNSLKPLAVFYVLACAWSWGWWIIGMSLLSPRSLASVEFIGTLWVGSFGPTVGALGAAWLTEGSSQVKFLVQKILLFRVGWRLYALMFFVMPTVFFVGYLIIGVIPVTGAVLMGATLVLAAPINGVMTALMSPGPLGEELGWRGYALPRLLEHLTPARASVVVGIAWAIWHAPLVVFPDWRNNVPIGSFVLIYPLSLIGLSFAFTAVHVRTGGSVGLAIWFHGVINFTAGVATNPELWAFDGYSQLARFVLIVALMCVTAAIMWFFLVSNYSKNYSS